MRLEFAINNGELASIVALNKLITPSTPPPLPPTLPALPPPPPLKSVLPDLCKFVKFK